MKNYINYILTFCLIFLVQFLSAQVVGGRGNGQSSPKEVKAGELSKGSYTSDVNLFTGALSTSHTLGSVSTPSGLSFTLSMSYSSSGAVGDNAPVVKGVSYGDGWSLDLPTISVSAESYRKYTEDEVNTQNANSNIYPQFSGSEAGLEGRNFWFSPEINIPGVISERFVYKYTESVSSNNPGEMVFVPHRFDKYVEARLKDNTWRVITEDGTVYQFGVSEVSVRNASNKRYLQGNIYDQNTEMYIPGLPNNQAIVPEFEYLSWTISKIHHTNYPNGQQIQFIYENFGAFNFYKEFLQPRYVIANGGTANNFTVYKDILLKTVRTVENFGPEYIEKIELNYKTNYPSNISNMPLLMVPGQTDVYRKDSLYNYKTVYATGIHNSSEQETIGTNSAITTTNNFNNWARYHHVRSNEAISSGIGSNKQMVSSNPYVYHDGTGSAIDVGVDSDPAGVTQYLVRSSASGDNLDFNECFLESPKIGGAGTNFFPAGDLYEIKALIYNGADEKFCNFDINILAGKKNPTESNQEASPGGIAALYYNTYLRNRSTTVFTTFNQALKWNSAAANSSSSGTNMVTSNLFVMPNLPTDFGGIRIQVGPGNSDHNFALFGLHAADIKDPYTEGIPNAFLAYDNELYFSSSAEVKYTAAHSAAPNNFGIGLEWHMMRRIASAFTDYTYNMDATRYKRWWNTAAYQGGSNNYNWDNQPTLADSDVKLMGIELIRYSKNPYMLASVETYRMNGVDFTTGYGKSVLINKLQLEYEVEINDIANNVDPTFASSSSANHASQKQYVFLLKRIREVPVNSANDNAVISNLDYTKLPTTHFGYDLIDTKVSEYHESFGRINSDVYVITSITDRLGGKTSYEYYDFDWYCVNTDSRWRSSNSIVVSNTYMQGGDADIHMGKTFGLGITLRLKKKIIEESLLNSSLPSKEFEYVYEEPVYRSATRPNTIGGHFDISTTRFQKGYKTVIVYEPRLVLGASRAKTVYTHYDGDQLFGKLKKSISYNVSGQLVEKKVQEYFIQAAYENGIYRSNPRIDAYYDITEKKFFPNSEGDYKTGEISVPPTNANLNFSPISFASDYGNIADMPFLEESNPALFAGQYLTSYFTGIKKDTVTNYEVQANTSSGIIVGLRSSAIPATPIGTIKLAVDALAVENVPHVKYIYNSYSNVTEYEYWDANSFGVTTCDGYRILGGGNPSNFSLELDYEPSWQLYKKKTYSPELPNAYQQDENFYFYDLRSEVFSVNGLDTLQNFYALNLSSGYKMRNLLYETRTTTKSQAFNPITKSTYYWYDARFVTQSDFELDGTFYFTSPYECGTIEEEENEGPTPPHTSCVSELPGHQIPPGFNLVITGEEGYRWWCPSSIYGSATDYQFPQYRFEQPGESREQIHFRDLKNKVFLRYIAQQVDANPNQSAEYTSIDLGSNKIMRFKLFSETGIEGYRPIYPFSNLINSHIDERNIYGQVKLEHNAKGLKTLYEYDEEQLYHFIDSNEPCNSHYIPSYTNVGMPNKVTVGYTLDDELSTHYTYYNDHSVQRIVNPNEIEMDYVYDEYTRLKETERNGILVSKNSYHYWDNDFNKTFEERAADNYVETFTINENNSFVAERSRAYIDPQGRKLDVLTQISPDYTDPLEYDTKMIHKGLTQYDNWNRNINQYKAFKTGDGINPEDFTPAVNPNPSTDPSQKTKYEQGQRSRPLRASKYGQDIVSGHTVNSSYVLIKGNVLASSSELGLNQYEKGVIVPGTMTNYSFLKTSVIDEDGKKVITYSDPFGRQVATKTYINPFTVATTLFIYDSQMNQALVLNPEKQLSTYLYNLLGQVYVKTTVDGGETRYIYDSDGKVVLVEDANAREGTDNNSDPYMRRFHYDDFGRLIKQERVALTSTDYFKYPFYNQNYSDNNDFTDAPDSGNPNSVPDIGFQLQQGYSVSTDYVFPLKAYNSVLHKWEHTTPYDYLSSIGIEKEFYYHNPLNLGLTYLDNRLVSYMGTNSQASNPATLYGKPSFTLAYNSSGVKTQLKAFKYNSDGTLGYEIHQFDPTELVSGTRAKVQAVKYNNYNLRGSYKDLQIDDGLNNINELIQAYEYDGWNRLTTVYANNVQIAQYNYIDELGLIEKVKLYNLGENTCTVQTDEIEYTYDIRDRLININSQLFEQALYYDNNVPNTGSGLTNVLSSLNYNGNINANKITYKVNSVGNYSGMGNSMDGASYYGYSYDGMNRLTRADASVMNVLASVSSITDPELKYGDESYTYDKIGNIKTLNRGIYYLPGTSSPANEVNNWIYYYSSGTNKLNEIVHNTGTFLQNISNYTYDENGNMRTDTKKEISSSHYGRANLPYNLIVDNESIAYLYNANDNRVYKSNTSTSEYYLQDQFGRTVGIYDYDAEEWTWYAYGKDKIAKMNSNNYLNEYYITDHLGNTRLTYQANIKCSPQEIAYSIINANDYYPYGKILRSYVNTDSEKYLFTGKERDKETELDYFEARMFDSEIGKFIQVDQLYEKAQNFSPYRYAFCNPIIFIDSDGNFETNYVDENGKTIINTNDGNDRVVEVKDENRKTFDTYVKIGKEKGAIDGEYYNNWMTAKIEGHDYIFPSTYQKPANAQSTQEASVVTLPLALTVGEKAVAPIAAAAVGWNIGDLIGKNIEAVSTATAAVLSTIIAEENLYGKIVSDSYGEHTKGARPSTKGKHEKGQSRKGTDRGGEKGDSSRRPPNKKPGGWKGPWPPKK